MDIHLSYVQCLLTSKLLESFFFFCASASSLFHWSSLRNTRDNRREIRGGILDGRARDAASHEPASSLPFGPRVNADYPRLFESVEVVMPALNAARALSHSGKFLSRADLPARLAEWREQGHEISFTNGCFDLLHPGHVSLLRQARAAADRLIVGLNSDASVGRLKGPTRPIQDADMRATVSLATETGAAAAAAQPCLRANARAV